VLNVILVADAYMGFSVYIQLHLLLVFVLGNVNENCECLRIAYVILDMC
jgi:hypothetical protein